MLSKMLRQIKIALRGRCFICRGPARGRADGFKLCWDCIVNVSAALSRDVERLRNLRRVLQ